MIEISMLCELLDYDASTGVLTWKHRKRELFKTDQEYKRWNTRYAGRRAFNRNPQGYRDGLIFKRAYREHHVVWAMHYGEWPSDQIDHINCIRDDNRISNLRVVTRSQNCRNRRMSRANSSGATGVSRHNGKWRAVITYSLGVFESFDDAVAARKAAEASLGFDPNHGAARHGIALREEAERDAA